MRNSTKRKALAATIVMAIGVLAVAHTAYDANEATSGGWKIRLDQESRHSGTHPSPSSPWYDWVWVQTSGPASESSGEGGGDLEGTYHGVSEQTKVMFLNPLSGMWGGRAGKALTTLGCDSDHFQADFFVSQDWHDNIDELFLAVGIIVQASNTKVSISSGTAHDAVHTNTKTARVRVESDTPNPGDVGVTIAVDWETDIESVGVPEVESNGSGGKQLKLDSNGDIVWESAPTTIARLTSSVEHVSGTSFRYTYLLENFVDEELTFEFKEITGPSNTNGWSGTVAANDEEELTFVATAGDDIWEQNTQCSVSSTSHEIKRPGVVYVPEGRVTFPGDVLGTSASYNSTTGKNEIEFNVTEAGASRAYLYRKDSTGVYRIVDELDQTLSPNVTYTMTDSTFPTGTNEYLVTAGAETNHGTTDDDLSVVNQ